MRLFGGKHKVKLIDVCFIEVLFSIRADTPER
jgi:hypothetical protein